MIPEFFDVGFGQMAAVLAVFLVGGYVKGVLGFGLPLVTMALLPLFVPVQTALVISALVQPVTNLGQLVSAGQVRQSARLTWPLLVALVPGAAVGTWFLSGIDIAGLPVVIGLTVLCFSVFTLAGGNVSIPPAVRRPVGVLCGFLAGIIGVLTTINSAFFIFYLVGCGADRQQFRASIAMLFMVSALLINGGFLAVGILTADRLALAALALLPAFVGMGLGNRLGSKMPVDTFRKLVLWALLVLGASFVIRGLV